MGKILSRKDVDEKRNQVLRERYHRIVEATGTNTRFVAGKVGIDNSYMNKWKLGQYNISDKNVNKIEKTLNELFPHIK